MTLYHCTTPKKLAAYQATGGILPPVRGWSFERSARAWGRKTGRTVLLRIETGPKTYPLPDHYPAGHGYWADEIVRCWVDVSQEAPCVSAP